MSCVRELVLLDSETMHQGQVEISKQGSIRLALIDRDVPAMIKTATGHESRQVEVAVPAGVAHSGSEKNHGIIEQGLPGGILFRRKLFQKAGKTMNVSPLDRDEVLDHLGIVAVVGEARDILP